MERAEADNVYSERYVAFIDILGFSEHVRKSANAPSEAKKILAIMDNQLRRWSEPAFRRTHEQLGQDFHHQSFSDCIVLSEAATPKGLHYLLFLATQTALDVLANGFLLRGGIAKGLLHHSKNAVFGPAFLAAYALEQNVAKYPRIVLDQATHQDFESNPLDAKWTDKFMRPNLAFADDGPVYVDIFSAFKFPDSNLPERVEVYRKECRANIQSKLDASIYIPAHYEKLQWLASVWNTTVERESGRNQWIVAPAQRAFEERSAAANQEARSPGGETGPRGGE
jgi:hypothetical protein